MTVVVVREIADPSPFEAVALAEHDQIAAHNAANAAAVAVNEAERVLGSAEKELNTLLNRPIFEKPRKEEIDAAMAKVSAARKARDEAKSAMEQAKTLMAWRAQEVAKARREAFEPTMADAIKRRVAAAERADELRAELADVEREFRAASSAIEDAFAKGAKLPASLKAPPGANFAAATGAGERALLGVR